MYSLSFTAKPEHIDFQGIMDGLYYPFYLEEVRHQYIKDVFGFDMVEQSKAGVNFVLVQYALKFKASLKQGDKFDVTCEALGSSDNKPFVYFSQSILREGKKVTEAIFKATCVSPNARLPFLPPMVTEALVGSPTCAHDWL